MVIIYTNLGETPLWSAIIINVIFFVGIFSRIIPAQAMIAGLPDPTHRGSFMSVISSVRQIGGGIASYVAGLIVIQMPNESLKHFDHIGYIVAATSVISIAIIYQIRRQSLSLH